TRLNSSSVMRPSATRASPSRSFLRLLAANTRRPWSKKTVFTIFPERTWRSPLLRVAESCRRVSAMGAVARSVSIRRSVLPCREGRHNRALSQLPPQDRHLLEDLHDHAG